MGSCRRFGAGLLVLGARQACVVSRGITSARGIEDGDPAGPTTVTSVDTTQPLDSGSEASTVAAEDGGLDAQ